MLYSTFRNSVQWTFWELTNLLKCGGSGEGPLNFFAQKNVKDSEHSLWSIHNSPSNRGEMERSGRVGDNRLGTFEDSAEAAPVRADSHRRCVVAMRGAGAICACEGHCHALWHLDQRAFVCILHHSSCGQRAMEASGRRRPGRKRGRDAHHVSARTTC